MKKIYSFFLHIFFFFGGLSDCAEHVVISLARTQSAYAFKPSYDQIAFYNPLSAQ